MIARTWSLAKGPGELRHTSVSVVLISRNQAWNISRLIESVLDGTGGIQAREIVLVDSASSDGTVEIARRYPIKILRLSPTQPLTPAAGRYVAYERTSGDLILFLDGDMEMCSGWLGKATVIAETEPAVAVVTGRLVDLPKATIGNNMTSFGSTTTGDLAVEVSQTGGAAMFRRSVLDEVGTFNPYLHSDEEPELCLRIRHAGYRIVSLEHPIARHYSDPGNAISTLVGRWRRNLWLGMGQSMRYHLGTELFWLYVKERGYGCLPGVAILTGVVSFVVSVLTRQWIWSGVWSSLLFVAIVALIVRKGSLYSAAFSLLQRLIVLDGTLRGFLIKPMPPDTYPCRVDTIQ